MPKRKIPEINAGSMADIAFLLLVFFLVTTTIQTDAGVNTTLPPWNPNFDPENAQKVNIRNVYAIQINAADQLLIRDRPGSPGQIKQEIKDFITNYGKRSDLSENPQSAVVSLLNDNGTSYNMYVTVYNEIKAAYNEVWDECAKSKFGYKYEMLTKDQKKEVRTTFPMIISEAEPANFGKK